MNHGRKVADGSVEQLRRMADKPVRIATLADGYASEELPRLLACCATWSKVSGQGDRKRTCPASEKVKAVEALAAFRGRFDDIELISPSLDETYAHFLKREVTA